MLSLQGSSPLPSHPKTLRDLTHAGQMLTLPAAFGSIQLGETFSCCLCVNNDVDVPVEAVSIKVEMQTASSKDVLADVGGLSYHLQAKDTLETVVSHEIRELGQHVLACNVSFRDPGIARTSQRGEVQGDTTLKSFRKFYKFAVRSFFFANCSPYIFLSR